MTASDFMIQAQNPPGPQITCGLLGNPSISRRGGSSASASSGGGGWQIVDRIWQSASTEWLDYNPLVMSLTLILDGGYNLPANSIEGLISTLEGYELPAPGTSPPRPPILTIAGPVPHTGDLWVCSGLTFPAGDDMVIRDPNTGQRTQQQFTLELTVYTPSSAYISALSPAQQAEAAQQALGG